MGKRVNLSAEEYKKLMKGTFFLGLEGNLKAWKKTETLDSVYGSSKITDTFFTTNKMYKAPVKYEDFLEPSVVEGVAKSAGKL
jgi:NitT/TauT family transport system substrate-binding protein